MAITAALVKELRERTGAGMMECKNALVEAGGDIEAAIEAMRKSGLAKAAKKAGRTAADGCVEMRISADGRQGVLVEVNSETDFVAKDANFAAFAAAVAETALASSAADADALLALPLAGGDGTSVEAARQALITKLGENIQVRRLARLVEPAGTLYSYRHGLRIGVLVCLAGGDEALGRDLAMHVAAANPICVADTDVPAEVLAKEREIYAAQAAESGKPPAVQERMVEGRVRKFFEEATLLGQPFVKDPDQRVGELLKKVHARVLGFLRFEVGEGIEKKASNFAEEVMAQVEQSQT